MSKPLFSVVVPTRNRLDTVTRTLESVLTQSFRDFELIVSDNSVGTQEPLKSWVSSRTPADVPVTFIRTGGDLDMDVNWETASLQAKGRYLLVIPDRWVMRGGVLALLANLVEGRVPECVFWDAKLSIDRHGRFQRPVDTSIPVHAEERRSSAILGSLLKFEGYATDTVFTQPFPRGLNCICRCDVVEAIRARVGRFFAPNACDYTSGISVLLNTESAIYLQDSLYIPIGSKSNGAQLSVFGLPQRLLKDAAWAGLRMDAVFLTVMNDFERTLRRHGAEKWLGSIERGNVLLSLLSEIHFKEWHGSPLDTTAMREALLDHAQAHAAQIGGDIVERLRLHDQRFAPSWRSARRILQRAHLFYPLYALKHQAKARLSRSTHQTYLDDHFGGRSVRMRDLAASTA
jgi:hypothetical protein